MIWNIIRNGGAKYGEYQKIGMIISFLFQSIVVMAASSARSPILVYSFSASSSLEGQLSIISVISVICNDVLTEETSFVMVQFLGTLILFAVRERLFGADANNESHFDSAVGLEHHILLGHDKWHHLLLENIATVVCDIEIVVASGISRIMECHLLSFCAVLLIFG